MMGVESIFPREALIIYNIFESEGYKFSKKMNPLTVVAPVAPAAAQGILINEVTRFISRTKEALDP